MGAGVTDIHCHAWLQVLSSQSSCLSFQTNFSLHIYLSTWSFAGKEKDGDVDSWVWSVLLESLGVEGQVT